MSDNRQAFMLAKQAADSSADKGSNTALRYLLGGGLGGGAGFLGGKYLLDLESPGALAATTGAGALTGLGTVALLEDAQKAAPQANKEEISQIVTDAENKAKVDHILTGASYIRPGLEGVAVGAGMMTANAVAGRMAFDVPKRNAFSAYQAPEKIGEKLLRYGKTGSNLVTQGLVKNIATSRPAGVLATALAAIWALDRGTNAAGEKAGQTALKDITERLSSKETGVTSWKPKSMDDIYGALLGTPSK